VACGHRAGWSGFPPAHGAGPASALPGHRRSPRHRPGVGRFVDQQLVFADARPKRRRRGGRPPGGGPVPCPIRALLSDMDLARPRLGLAALHNEVMQTWGGRGVDRWRVREPRIRAPPRASSAPPRRRSPASPAPPAPRQGSKSGAAPDGSASHWLPGHLITRSPRPTRSPSGPSKGPRTPASSDAAREPARSAVSCSARLSRRRLHHPGRGQRTRSSLSSIRASGPSMQPQRTSEFPRT